MKIAGIIPYHRLFTEEETYSVCHAVKTLGQVNFYVMQEDSNLPDIYKEQQTYIPPEGTLRSIQSYNDFLLRRKVYDDFSSYDRMIIVQNDCIVLNNYLDEYLSYSYFGSKFYVPKILNGLWFGNYPRLGHFLSHLKIGDEYVYGNGGFSIRDVSFCKTHSLNISNNTYKSLRLSSIIGIREDVYWSWAARKYGVHTYDKAVIERFGLDRPADNDKINLKSLMAIHDFKNTAPSIHQSALKYIGYRET
jgi:hypothetical protein